MSGEYTFEKQPGIVAMLAEEIKALREEIRHNHAVPKAKTDEMMDLKGLHDFHPEHPAAATIYKWVRNGQIPYYKTGKKLIFKRSEIEAWINEGRQMTDAEIEAEAIDYINRRRTGK